MRLIVTEKPDAAKHIAAALGIQGSRSNGAIQGSNAIVTWCIGHLAELAAPDHYNPLFKSWSWATLPILPERFDLVLQDDKGRREQAQAIMKLMNDPRITEIVNACDCAREGELIFHEVYQLSRSSKPVLRFWCSSLMEDAVREAYGQMKPASNYQGLCDSAIGRQRADWLFGLNGTRAQTLATRHRGKADKGVASIGRVQTPTLFIVYQRDQAIQNFVPEPFWRIFATFQAPEGTYVGRWFTRDRDAEGKERENDRFLRQEDARMMLARLQGAPALITEVRQEQKKTPPETLYSLSTLQMECNKRFGLTAQQTLDVAQALYEEHQVITYPRTSSNHITEKEADKLPEILRDISVIPAYGPIHQEMETAGLLAKGLTKRHVDASKVSDHHALLPTGKVPSGLTPVQANVYDLIARRVMAAYFPDRVDAKTTILTQITDQNFKTNGTVLVDPGWTRIDPTGHKAKDDEAGDDDEAGSLPNVQKGAQPQVTKLDAREGTTTPPKPLTEGDLIKSMKGAGRMIEDEALAQAMKDMELGTEATRANIIETLIRRGFLRREKKKIHCTPDGASLIESIEVDLIKSPDLTGQWEAKLARMVRGEYPLESFITEVKQFTAQVVQSILNGLAATPEELAILQRPRTPPKQIGTCFQCASPLLLKEWDGRHYVTCSKAKNKKCMVAFDSDAEGNPAAGTCKNADCAGPVRATRSGSRICVKCNTWQDSNALDSGIPCDKCAQQNYKKIPKKHNQFFLKCEGCSYTRDTDAEVRPGSCKAEGCGGTLVLRQGKFGPLWSCARCPYYEAVEGSSKRPTRNGWSRTPTDHVCPKCKTQKLGLVENNGRDGFYSCGDRENCGYSCPKDKFDPSST